MLSKFCKKRLTCPHYEDNIKYPHALFSRFKVVFLPVFMCFLHKYAANPK